MEQLITGYLKKSISAKDEFVKTHTAEIILLSEWIIDSLTKGGKILIFGNGGSAADAQHMAAEFINRFMFDRAPLAAIALSTDVSVLTSIGNDYSFDDIFVKQVRALGKREDLALGISTSGNSMNVIKAIRAASEMGLKTAALTGGSGGQLLKEADLVLNVPSYDTPHIQETHIWTEHLLCLIVEEAVFGKSESS